MSRDHSGEVLRVEGSAKAPSVPIDATLVGVEEGADPCLRKLADVNHVCIGAEAQRDRDVNGPEDREPHYRTDVDEASLLEVGRHVVSKPAGQEGAGDVFPAPSMRKNNDLLVRHRPSRPSRQHATSPLACLAMVSKSAAVTARSRLVSSVGRDARSHRYSLRHDHRPQAGGSRRITEGLTYLDLTGPDVAAASGHHAIEVHEDVVGAYGTILPRIPFPNVSVPSTGSTTKTRSSPCLP